MQLYFSPLACSMASRIVIYELGLSADFIEVAPTTKLLTDGSTYRAIHPLGLVPALRLDDGQLLTENTAILPYLAEQRPDAGLVPRDENGRMRLRQWLGFITSELHKVVYSPLIDKVAPEVIRYALAKAESRFELLAAHLDGREHLLDAFTIADAYLVTVLSWSPITPIDLGRWPVIARYVQRLRQRPTIARALSEETRLHLEHRKPATQVPAST
jgi:glutathione S-transferase